MACAAALPYAMLFRESGLSGSETRDGDAEWTATDIVEAEAMTEFHRIWIAAVFAADAELNF